MNQQEKEEVKEVIIEPMGDDDIREYFPDALIIKYSDLKDYNDIRTLLRDDKSFFFLLYQDKPNTGHWVCLSRRGNTIEYFDSYGKKIDEPLSWMPHNALLQLGIYKPYLTNLLNKTKYDVVYNPIEYQTDKRDINTCGRHCVFRLKNMQKNVDLADYYKLMKHLKDKYKVSYDVIVSQFINAV